MYFSERGLPCGDGTDERHESVGRGALSCGGWWVGRAWRMDFCAGGHGLSRFFLLLNLVFFVIGNFPFWHRGVWSWVLGCSVQRVWCTYGVSEDTSRTTIVVYGAGCTVLRGIPPG